MILASLILLAALGPDTSAPSAPHPVLVAPTAPFGLLELHTGHLTLATETGLETLFGPNADRVLAARGHLEVGALSEAELRWIGRGSLRIWGPSVLDWQGLPFGGETLGLLDFTRVEVEVREGKLGLRLPGGVLLVAEHGALELVRRSSGAFGVHNLGGRRAALFVPAEGAPERRDVEAGTWVWIDPADYLGRVGFEALFAPVVAVLPAAPLAAQVEVLPFELATPEPAPVEPAIAEPALVEPALTEHAPVELAPVELAPVELAPVKLAPVKLAPVERAPVERAPVTFAPVEVVPVASTPAEFASFDVPSVESTPGEPASVVSAPIELAPLEVASAEPKPAGPAPAEAEPVEPARVELGPFDVAAAILTPAELAPVAVAPSEPTPPDVATVETALPLASPIRWKPGLPWSPRPIASLLELPREKAADPKAKLSRWQALSKLINGEVPLD